jgi:RIO-like serine/threonine protein kinase
MHQKMTSKRNQVQRVIKDNNNYISKTFLQVDDFINEIKLLKMLKEDGANVPNILEEGNNFLFLEDMGDETLLNRIESMEKHNRTEYKDLILKLSNWLKIFYSITFSRYGKMIILNDVNYRNFILFKNEIYGIDFEQSCPGSIETDAGKLSAYALTYEPSMTQWKIDFRNELINILSEELNIDRQQILNEEKKEIKSIENRRKISLDNYWNLL